MTASIDSVALKGQLMSINMLSNRINCAIIAASMWLVIQIV
jgi:hypothetical protein